MYSVTFWLSPPSLNWWFIPKNYLKTRKTAPAAVENAKRVHERLREVPLHPVKGKMAPYRGDKEVDSMSAEEEEAEKKKSNLPFFIFFSPEP